MPKRTDIHRVLVIGSGPIVIGQACEFDYSGTQAIKALKSEGLEVVLVNSNPATIMTDPELADRTYVEPLTPAALERIIERERPDALLPTVGGQTALNLAVQLDELGVLGKHGVELIGAQIPAIKVAEDRKLLDRLVCSIGQPSGLQQLCRFGPLTLCITGAPAGAALLDLGPGRELVLIHSGMPALLQGGHP